MLTTLQRSSAAFRAPTAGPVSVAVSIVDERGDDVPMDGWTGATVAGDAPATVRVVAEDVENDQPAYVLLTTDGPLTADHSGLLELQATVKDATGGLHQLEPLQIVVEVPDGWHTLASARNNWADAPKRDAVLWELLDAARQSCLDYAPLGVDVQPPSGHRQAQLNVARAIWQRTKAGTDNDQMGVDGYAVRVYIDDPDTRRLLRPRRIRGGIA